MLNLIRDHDFQVVTSPNHGSKALTNPPSFNWPETEKNAGYHIVIEHTANTQRWQWSCVNSPLQLNFKFAVGEYRWQISTPDDHKSEWMHFYITKDAPKYIAPNAATLFELCANKDQWMMYFDEDIQQIDRETKNCIHQKFINTSVLAGNDSCISYPEHYKRGAEEGKTTAITSVSEWIDRDLMTQCLLYKIWGNAESGTKAINRLLKLAQWSPEGPASLLRPCPWGDEVGLSLSRNLFLAYHWLSPILTESEKDFIRPMLIRIAHQMEIRLDQDKFHQYPGHSHTSRLPAYLGVAALVLHKEYALDICEKWLNYALMIYRGIFPFYGGSDGSWADGAFYSSSYSKWHHPFFLSVERLSGFSFYNHPFYKEYANFAMDFVISEQDVHPFGDGFWCKSNGVEWPGLFSQNPLSIYAERYGDGDVIIQHDRLKKQIHAYQLHLLDVIPTVYQIKYKNEKFLPVKNKVSKDSYNKFYKHAGFGITRYSNTRLFFRSSLFGNSSHRHADQGNIALIDNGIGVLVPTGSFGYRFASAHHSAWTRQTKAHNLPLINHKGQIIDNECATAELINTSHSPNWTHHQMDLSKSYDGLDYFTRHVIVIPKVGVIIVDDIKLQQEQTVQWRLHSQIPATASEQKVTLADLNTQYSCTVHSDQSVSPSISQDYDQEINIDAVVSDPSTGLYHLQWEFEKSATHYIVASCIKKECTVFYENNTITIQHNNLTCTATVKGQDIQIAIQ